MPKPTLSLSDFDFALPPELVAQVPTLDRSASQLLHVDGERLADLRFADFPALLAPGDLVVLNDTRVIKARVIGRKASGGRVEILIERIVAIDEAWAQIRASHLPRPGSVIELPGETRAEVIERDDRFFRLRLRTNGPLLEWLDRHGAVPLPPYIARSPVAADQSRYQTVYAREPGAVAAPTAGLHFDDAILAALASRQVAVEFVTLHVGAGTFQPVASEDLARHRMHSEWFRVPAATAEAIAGTRAKGGRVVAVGTTSLRALESASDGQGRVQPGEGETALFVTPGYRFRVVDRLLTNFHLPKSTLLMLVSAFAGYDGIRAAYAHAIAQNYRFFSYGDAMLLERDSSGSAGAST